MNFNQSSWSCCYTSKLNSFVYNSTLLGVCTWMNLLPLFSFISLLLQIVLLYLFVILAVLVSLYFMFYTVYAGNKAERHSSWQKSDRNWPWLNTASVESTLVKRYLCPLSCLILHRIEQFTDGPWSLPELNVKRDIKQRGVMPPPPPRGVLSIMDYMDMRHPKEIPFSG